MRRLLGQFISGRGPAMGLFLAVLLFGLMIGGAFAEIGDQLEVPRKHLLSADGTPFEEPEYAPGDHEDEDEDAVFNTVPNLGPRDDEEVESEDPADFRPEPKPTGFDRLWRVWSWVLSIRRFYF